MNTIITQIQNDFVKALKEKNESAKRALSFLKSKLTEVEKTKKGVNLEDNDVYDVVSKLIKQRKESIEIYTKVNRLDLVEKELQELKIISNYQPVQFSFKEILDILIVYYSNLKKSNLKGSALVGNMVGLFNKSYKGRAELNLVKSIAEDIVSEKNFLNG
jgi:hypothetical protein